MAPPPKGIRNKRLYAKRDCECNKSALLAQNLRDEANRRVRGSNLTIRKLDWGIETNKKLGGNNDGINNGNKKLLCISEAYKFLSWNTRLGGNNGASRTIGRNKSPERNSLGNQTLSSNNGANQTSDGNKRANRSPERNNNAGNKNSNRNNERNKSPERNNPANRKLVSNFESNQNSGENTVTTKTLISNSGANQTPDEANNEACKIGGKEDSTPDPPMELRGPACDINYENFRDPVLQSLQSCSRRGSDLSASNSRGDEPTQGGCQGCCNAQFEQSVCAQRKVERMRRVAIRLFACLLFLLLFWWLFRKLLASHAQAYGRSGDSGQSGPCGGPGGSASAGPLRKKGQKCWFNFPCRYDSEEDEWKTRDKSVRYSNKRNRA